MSDRTRPDLIRPLFDLTGDLSDTGDAALDLDHRQCCGIPGGAPNSILRLVRPSDHLRWRV